MALAAVANSVNSADRQIGHVQLVQLLFQRLDATFPAIQSCGDYTDKPITLKQYIAKSLGYLAEEKSKGNRVSTRCEKAVLNDEFIQWYSELAGDKAKQLKESFAGMNKGEKLQICEVSFSHDAGEIVWNRSVRFIINDKTGMVLEHSFRCLMTP